jgi:limonene 1,2-monooxygenase
MKFGIFLAPFHRIGEDPTLALERDLELIELLDRLGYDEAWIGEHHSAGREIIADPVAFIAAASRTTRQIKLGTGVTSLPYHHPLIVADQMVMLDHLTRGRAMLGVGPGALTSDAYMMGIEPMTQRRRMDEALEAVMALLRAEGPVNMETDWFVLRDARLQIASYTYPHLPVAVAAAFTPSGPTAAGKHGVGLLSVAGVASDRFPSTWRWMEEAAAKAGRQVDRGEWRVVVPFYLAETREQAIADVAEGYRRRAYFGDGPPLASAATPFVGRGVPPATIEEAIEQGTAIVGTPDDAIAALERIVELSGGIGGLLTTHHEWAGTQHMTRSFELWARYVAPHFRGQMETLHSSRDWFASKRGEFFGDMGKVMARAYEDAGQDVPEVLKQAQAAAGASPRDGR